MNGMLSFKQIFILNLISTMFLWTYYLLIDNTVSLQHNALIILTYSIFIILITCFAYFFEKQNKKAFYYLSEIDKKGKWSTNVLDNMNNGYIHFKDNKIDFINNFLLDKIFQIKRIKALYEKFSNDENKNMTDEKLESQESIIFHLTFSVNSCK
jgi:hypothetical protein